MTYETQLKIRNWGQKNQKLIDGSKVLISGGGLLTNLILANFTGLGVGDITIIDNDNNHNDKEFLYKLSNSNISKKVKNLGSIIREMNDKTNIKTVYSDLNYSILDDDYNIIIDASNNPNNKAFCLEFALKSEVPFISAAASEHKIEIRNLNKNNFNRYENNKKNLDDFLFIEYGGKEQGPIPCGVGSAEVANMLRKFNFLLSKDERISDYFVYNLKNSRRFFPEDDCEIKDYNRLDNVVPVLIGAGALGNPIALLYSLMGVKKMIIMDDDKIDSTNLNRQFLYYNAVGRYKVDVLKEILEKVNGTKIEAKKLRFDNTKYDAIPKGKDITLVSCVDNFETRAAMNEYAVKNKIRLINASSNSTLSKISVYFPDKTACLNCQFPLYDIAEKHKRLRKENEKREAGTCTAHNHDPSVVYTNTLAGSIVVGEDFSYQNNNILKGNIVYNSLGSYMDKVIIGPKISSKKGCGCNG
jgi:molybdopterin/thiamine biosynthesis adenylyltransferase